MKQKLFKIFILSLLSVGWLFNFGFVEKAQAACVYRIERFETDSKTYPVNGVVTFYIKVSKTGLFADCNKTARLNYYVKTSYTQSGGSYGTSAYIVDRNLFASHDATFTVSATDGMRIAEHGHIKFSLASFDFSKVTNPSQLHFFADVVVDNSVMTSSIDTPYPISITGQNAGSGERGVMNLNVGISAASLKNVYELNKSGEKLTVEFTVPVPDLQRYPDRTKVLFYVGNQLVTQYTKTKTELQYKQNQVLYVMSNGGFVAGENTIKVEVYEDGTNDLVSRGTIKVQVQGPATVPGGQNPGIPGPVGTENPGIPGGGNPGTPNQNPGIPGGGGATMELPNVLKCDNLVGCTLGLVRWFMGILGILAVVFVMIGGFQMVTSAGNEDAYSKGKRTITWAIGGLVVALLSFAMVAIVQNILDADVPPAAINQKQNAKT